MPEPSAYFDRFRDELIRLGANPVGIGAFAAGEHGAHLVDPEGQARRLAPALEQVPAFAVRVGQRLAVIAAGDARTDFGHFLNGLPEPVAVDPKVFAGSRHRRK